MQIIQTQLFLKKQSKVVKMFALQRYEPKNDMLNNLKRDFQINPNIKRQPTPSGKTTGIVFKNESNDVYSLVVDGKKIGICTAVLRDIQKVTTLYIANFAIVPAYQGLGFAEIFFNNLDKLAKEQGVPLALDVEVKNFAAISLYDKMGFQVIREWGSTGNYIYTMIKG